ncbi:MAG: MarR family winged helix-turn-helix transcriptional regulator [Nocardioidaceae bacterium]
MIEPSAAELQEAHYLIGQALRGLLRLAPEVHALLAQRAGVGTTDLMALDRLTTSDHPMGIVELGDSLDIRSASATVLVDRLVSAGHLQRANHPTDGRRRIVRVTGSAREDMLVALRPLVAGINQVTDRLDAETSRLVLHYLRDVCRALEDFVSPPEPAAGSPSTASTDSASSTATSEAENRQS